MTEITREDDSFDGVVCVEVLDNIPRHLQEKALRYSSPHSLHLILAKP